MKFSAGWSVSPSPGWPTQTCCSSGPAVVRSHHGCLHFWANQTLKLKLKLVSGWLCGDGPGPAGRRGEGWTPQSAVQRWSASQGDKCSSDAFIMLCFYCRASVFVNIWAVQRAVLTVCVFTSAAVRYYFLTAQRTLRAARHNRHNHKTIISAVCALFNA